MTLLAGLLMAGALLEGAPKPTHFDVTATFTPARRKRRGRGRGPVRGQGSRREDQRGPGAAPEAGGRSGHRGPARASGGPPAKGGPAGAGPGHYLDLTLPVTFPVTLAPGTPRGTHDAKGTVTYFYCSKREGWCRKGTAEVAFPIAVP